MNTLLDRLKNIRVGKKLLGLIISLLIGLFMYYLLVYVFTPFGAMSRFPAAILLMWVGISVWIFVDRFFFPEIDTVQEIKKGNIAYALVLFAIALIIAAVITTV